jgi:broad specificity phosphatase PhoE
VNRDAVVMLVRHGETEWSRSGQHTSRTDLPLLADGVTDAEALGRRLAGRSFALVLASPMARARETARLAGLGDSVEITDDLHELGYGEYEGRTTADIRIERPGWDIWADGSPGGESLADAGARADRVIARIEAAGGDVSVFGHGHMLRILGARWLGLPPHAGSGLALSTGSLCILGYERERRVIWLWNDTSHAGGV